MSNRTVSCPRCGAAVRWDAQSPFRPFCSERCKMIDLGAWASDEYRVPVKGEGEAAEAAPTEAQRRVD